MFPLDHIPKETKCFPDLTGKLRQIDAFPRAIGKHSDVSRAYRINDERQKGVLALKTLRAGSCSDPSFETLVQTKPVELVNQWVQHIHPNVAKIHGVAYGSGSLPAVVMDSYDAGSIVSYMKAQAVTEEEKLQWVKEIALALKYLHMRKTPVVDGDVRGANVFVKANKECVLADVGMIYTTDMPGFVQATAQGGEPSSSRRDPPHVEGPATPPTPEGDASAEGVRVPPPCSPSADAAGQSGGSHEQWTETESDTAGKGTKTRDENGKLEIVGYAEEVWVETIDMTNAGRDVTVHKTCNYYYPQPETDRILADRTSQLETSLSSLMKDFSSMSQDLASGANVSSDLRQRIETIDSRLKRLEQLITDSAGSPHINAGPSGISTPPPPGSVAPISPQPMVTLPPVASTPTPSTACPTFTWVPVPIAFFHVPTMAGSVAPMPTRGMPVVPPPHSGDSDTPLVPQTSPPNSPLATSTSTDSP
ncbi:hypothetical protein FA13DRAFT_1740534 [Coprinellus micaceus]|uniref:Protein kinase domain-containing protein n=1 Tax=Coprinellus micaceus TaxID=71717 RepID=A0A4Y7SM02_COPMI|nr:hypothetical protein FA13DRAFT_1740534 [Coprinellus micaceus]